MTTATQVRIDSKVKADASAIFSKLGLDMSSAINIFLHQCVLKGGLPFNVEIPNYNKETIEAMAEAKQISHDPKVKGYQSIEDLNAALDSKE